MRKMRENEERTGRSGGREKMNQGRREHRGRSWRG